MTAVSCCVGVEKGRCASVEVLEVEFSPLPLKTLGDLILSS